MTDINHDARISALEEKTVAFYAVITDEELTIEEDTTVIFPDVLINNGDGQRF